MAKRYLSKKGSPRFYAPRGPSPGEWTEWINHALTSGLLQMESIDSHGAYWIAAHVYLDVKPDRVDELRDHLSANPNYQVSQSGNLLHVTADTASVVLEDWEHHDKGAATIAYTNLLKDLSGYPDTIASGAWEWEFDA
jgi:hypothetical protein